MTPESTIERWAAALGNARAIAGYIGSIAPDYVDEELVEEYFHGCRAVLALVPIAELREGPADVNVPSKKKAAAYAKLPPETMPPLVVMNGVVEDGHHRLRDARRRGVVSVLCYVVEYIDD